MAAVEDIVCSVFGVERGTVDENSAPGSVEGWDSMGHMNLVAALEQRFNVSIDIDDVMQMANVGKIRQILAAYGARG